MCRLRRGVSALVGTLGADGPTGATIHDPDRSSNAFTVLSPLGTQAVLVIDMNGNLARRWDGFNARGEIVWEWLAGDHIGEIGFAPDAGAVIRAAAAFNEAPGSFDWLHVDSATYVGPNQWYDNGDHGRRRRYI